MKKITKKQFLVDVLHEINMLKAYATSTELARLDFTTFDFQEPEHCIYGQMAGSCDTERAKILMDKACIRVMSLEYGVSDLSGNTYDEIKDYINGENTGQGWNKDEIFGLERRYTHLSALEGYICLEDAKVNDIIKYLRGNINKLVL